MIVSRHAVRRLKDHALVPKTMDGHKAREFIKKTIKKHTRSVYINKKTLARVHITDKLIALMYGSRVVTVYPNDRSNRERFARDVQLRQVQ